MNSFSMLGSALFTCRQLSLASSVQPHEAKNYSLYISVSLDLMSFLLLATLCSSKMFSLKMFPSNIFSTRMIFSTMFSSEMVSSKIFSSLRFSLLS